MPKIYCRYVKIRNKFVHLSATERRWRPKVTGEQMDDLPEGSSGVFCDRQ